MKAKAAKPKAKRGPRPESLKIEGSWESAVKRSFSKKRPPEGWPKQEK